VWRVGLGGEGKRGGETGIGGGGGARKVGDTVEGRMKWGRGIIKKRGGLMGTGEGGGRQRRREHAGREEGKEGEVGRGGRGYEGGGRRRSWGSEGYGGNEAE